MTKQSNSLRDRKLPLRGGTGTMPVLGFGTLIPDAAETRQATRTALDVGFRHIDCAERYGNEEHVGTAIREALQAGSITRGDLLLRPSCGTTIIARSASNPHSRRALPGCK